ncbi:MAG TPA: DUF3616 domain-containing protein [Blastocatellia bacterium]|jgi:hypothetical protein|nr:DUF3616 domain-containing protein [Blastocatellia bacterium]
MPQSDHLSGVLFSFHHLLESAAFRLRGGLLFSNLGVAMTKVNIRPAALEFDAAIDAVKDGKSLRDNLSAVAHVGRHLWLASDETACIERLSAEDGLAFRNHKRFRLSDFVPLPQDDDGEADLEAFAYGDNFLWVVGSHGFSREKPDQKSSEVKPEIKRLAQIDSNANRYTLARIPLVENQGELELRESCPDPSAPWRTLTAAHLPFTKGGNALTDALSDDAHLGPFLSIPGKDNGFDIEGLAVSGARVFVGLRGPVLRGWAIILELEMEETESRHLSLKKIGPKDRPFKKHFLQLDGLGIRDLLVHESDLLILAGPTMDLDGPVAVFRWKDGARAPSESLVPRDTLDKLFDVPYAYRADHAEGITLISKAGESPALLVVYDSPAGERKIGEHAVRADVFELR